MSFTTSAGRMIVTDGATTVFDTNERLFTVTNGPLTGSITLPDHTTTQQDSPLVQNFIDVDTNHSLGYSINSSADTIRGAFKVTATVTDSAVARLQGLGWFNASGSYVHFMRPRSPTLSPTSNANAGLPNFAVYTFIISGGALYLNEQVRLSPNPTGAGSGLTFTTMTLPGAFIEYYLFVGAWI